jgi:hypothetical protein
MRDTMELGPAPCDEDCAQVGTPDYPERSRAECQRYIARIRQVLGPEPEGARLTVKTFPHDFGTYREVVIVYDDENAEAQTYAYRCEGEAPARWED